MCGNQYFLPANFVIIPGTNPLIFVSTDKVYVLFKSLQKKKRKNSNFFTFLYLMIALVQFFSEGDPGLRLVAPFTKNKKKIRANCKKLVYDTLLTNL